MGSSLFSFTGHSGHFSKVNLAFLMQTVNKTPRSKFYFVEIGGSRCKFRFIALLNIVVGKAVPSVPKRFRGCDAP